METSFTLRPLGPRPLEADVLRAVRIFRERIGQSFSLSRLLVFGSRARGGGHADSDADLAVVLDGTGGNRWVVASELARVAFDVLLETDVLIDPLPLWETELEHPDRTINPGLFQAILRDGVPV